MFGLFRIDKLEKKSNKVAKDFKDAGEKKATVYLNNLLLFDETFS